ncbi:similar to Saccharomyces cerevisiae YML006C GIS4 CAAX box containing protein of unknown function, proposed to be involved in the RAS/cAMP signaling pathway [Maudiozyma barnettii]|nr:similar to Saccharomyces cerevisiae YML006C GIS4 CAAX box containing protein of unknown function, proposed to be involved in the RAS/cAMP signaling pathway [Kazachstania barnettii]
MPKSVRVGDYYDNDDNGLWSWYLENIRSGDFEELTQNELKFTLLRRFLYNKFIKDREDDTDNFAASKNSKILFISIPDNIHSDISLLETFLKEYFHLEDLTNIKILKLTHDKTYHHENHYVLIDTLNNFDDPTFLEYVNPKDYKYNDSISPSQNNNNSIINFPNSNMNIHVDSKQNMNIHVDSKQSDGPHENNISTTKTITNEGERLLDTVRTVTGGTTDHIMTYTHSGSVSSSRESSYSSSSYNSSSASSSISSALYSSSFVDSNTVSRSVESSSRSMGSVPQPLHTPSGKSQNNNDTSRTQSLGDKKDITNDGNSSYSSQSHSINNSENIRSINMLEDMEDATGSIIEINFPRTKLHTKLSGEQNEPVKQLTTSRVYNPRGDNTGIYTPPQSEIISINSFADTRSKILEVDTEPLHQTRSRSELSISIKEDEESNDFNPYDEGLESNDAESRLDSSSFSSSITVSTQTTSADSIYSILPSISIRSPQGHFRLVLQSMLTLNEDRQIYTAIRQSNNLLDDADVSDDWILYDQKFSMNNLIMLTLKDLFEWGQNLKKILFYSMVFIDNAGVADDNNLESHTKDLAVNNSVLKEPENSDMEIPQLLFSDDAERDPTMHIPERVQTNNTIAHRSIRTINSIGEWAFKKKSNATDRYSGSYDSSDSENGPQTFYGDGDVLTSTNTRQNTKDNIMIDQKKSKKKNTKNLKDLEHVARWKSVPNKSDPLRSNEGSNWKKNMKRFSKGKPHNQKETFCTIT